MQAPDDAQNNNSLTAKTHQFMRVKEKKKVSIVHLDTNIVAPTTDQSSFMPSAANK